MAWKPISREDLLRHIDNIQYLLEDDERCFWNFIKIDPEKWEEPRMEKEGGGFWVVAIFGHQVLYYNDIEDGFNFSTYHRYGLIDEYVCAQTELDDVIRGLSNLIKEGKLQWGK